MGLLISQLFVQQPDNKLFDHILKKQIEQKNYFISKLEKQFKEHKESDMFDENMHEDMLTNYHIEVTYNNFLPMRFTNNEQQVSTFSTPNFLRVIDIDEVTGEFSINDYTNDIKKIFRLELQTRDRIESMIRYTYRMNSIEQFDKFIHDYPDDILSNIYIVRCKLTKNVF